MGTPQAKIQDQEAKQQRITRQLVVDLSPPKAGNRVVWDCDVTGFGVRITSAGALAFVLRYVINGRERRYTIGKHPDVTVAKARDTAVILRGHIAAGSDPLETRTEAREAPTVAVLCDDYLERHARPKKRGLSVKQDERIINRLIKPKLGNRKVASISRRDVDELHQDLTGKPYQANRLLALLSKMFSLAVLWGWRPINPAKGIERFHEDKRDRWLSAEELTRLTSAIKGYPDKRVANAVRLLMLTGARRTEVLTATWDQFDLARRVWTKPSHHTKQKKTEHVPLSGPALALVSGMKSDLIKKLGSEDDLKTFPYLFPGDADGKPLQDIKKAWAALCTTANIQGARLHDLRHTYASHLVSGGHSLPLVGRLLGHTQPSTTQRYAHLADDPLRKATEEFGVIVTRKAKRVRKNSGQVVPFRTSKRGAGQ
jgi:integrase